MGSAWPLMPAWVEVADGPVRRGERVRVRWDAGRADGHELRLALVVRHKARMSTPEGLGADGGRFGVERQGWAVHDRAPLTEAGGTARLQVPSDGPYSYPGTILAFLWGVALAGADTPFDQPLGWSAVQVLP